jgi:uroporphyrinogen-III synthase
MEFKPRPRQSPEWYVISLRPQGEHRPLRRPARARGAGVFACSPLRLLGLPSPTLDTALACPRVVFTSPAAVRFAVLAQGGLRARPGQAWIAVGAGTARALGRLGIDAAHPLQHMDSDGLLALPALAAVDGVRIGLVTAPGGRGLIQSTLRTRGAEVVRADVYTREPVALRRQRLQRLAGLPRPAVLLVSSAEALASLQAQLPGALLQRLREDPVVVSSARLEQIVREAGFMDPRLAHSASPPDLLLTAAHAAGQGFG